MGGMNIYLVSSMIHTRNDPREVLSPWILVIAVLEKWRKRGGMDGQRKKEGRKEGRDNSRRMKMSRRKWKSKEMAVEKKLKGEKNKGQVEERKGRRNKAMKDRQT